MKFRKLHGSLRFKNANTCNIRKFSEEKVGSCNYLDYDHKFEFQSLLQSGNFIFEDFSQEVLNLFSQKSLSDCVFSTTHLKNEPSTPGDHKTVSKRLKDLITKKKYLSQSKITQKNLCLIKHVRITPFDVFVEGHKIQRSCDVVRKFGSSQFAVVEFSNFKEIVGGTWIDKDLKVVMERVLSDGLVLFGKTYRFIAASGSGLKEGKAWFVMDDENLSSVDVIRQYIGDLSNILKPSKYLSRLSLGFTSSIPTVEVKNEEFVVLDDIKRSYRGMFMFNECVVEFTEGCGVISPACAKEVCSMLGTKDDFIFSAYQIRFGGFKGVLVVDRDWEKYSRYRIDPTVELKVVFRKSQEKFVSKDAKILNIVNTSQFHTNHTNRQNLLLSTNMGIKDQYYLDMSEKVLEDFDDTLGSAFNNDSIRKYGGILNNLHPLYHPSFEDVVDKDPFLLHFRMALSIKILGGMSRYQRIPVSDEQGAILMGVYDFSGNLEEDEVYVSCLHSGKKLTYEGRVIVGRSPCHHPGDLRILKAVRNEKLDYLTNVIVFSVKGEYPQFLKMAGGDLDGDLYWIMKIDETEYFEELKEKDFHIQPDAQTTTTTSEKVTKVDLVNFYVDHFYHNNIGEMSNEHLSCADNLGVEDHLTISLAGFFWIFLDFFF